MNLLKKPVKSKLLNSYQYFNIWVIKKFLPESNGNTLLGFAQFPFSGSMATDGVVLIYSEFNDPSSSTLTHEAGHWLGLCHPWDCGTGTCGDDNIFDTPPAREANYGVALTISISCRITKSRVYS